MYNLLAGMLTKGKWNLEKIVEKIVVTLRTDESAKARTNTTSLLENFLMGSVRPRRDFSQR
jgi:hypothetical protein